MGIIFKQSLKNTLFIYLVSNIVKNAPFMKQWKITAFRPRLHQRNQIIDLDGISMDYHDVFFDYEVDLDHKNIILKTNLLTCSTLHLRVTVSIIGIPFAIRSIKRSVIGRFTVTIYSFS